MEAKAILRNARIAPRKVQIVLDLIRGKDYDVAMATVKHTPKAASEYLEKLLKSAAHNAENNHNMSKDSLYVFIEATLAPQDSDEPVFRKDSIVFITNTNRQNVKLLAYGQDFVSLRQKEITQDTLISSARPIVIYDSLSVKEGARLTIGAGTRFYFHGKSSIQVHGQLVAEGTLEAPVVFRTETQPY